MNASVRVLAGVLVVAAAATACGGSSSPSRSQSVGPTVTQGAAATTTTNVTTTPGSSTASTAGSPSPGSGEPNTSQSGVDPNAPERVEPGDIPDNQVFVPFAMPGGEFTVAVPEGWTRTEAGDVVTFTDNYNSVALQAVTSSAAPTIEGVRTSGLDDVRSDPSFHLVDVAAVTRRSGDGVLARYEVASPPNPVTGRSATLSVERYEFGHGGTVAVLTLSGAKGADNVDPWRKITDSLTWP